MFRKKIYIVIILVLLLLSIFGGTYLVKRNQDTRRKAEGGYCNPICLSASHYNQCGYSNADGSCTTNNACCHRVCMGGTCTTVVGGGANECDGDGSSCSSGDDGGDSGDSGSGSCTTVNGYTDPGRDFDVNVNIVFTFSSDTNYTDIVWDGGEGTHDCGNFGVGSGPCPFDGKKYWWHWTCKAGPKAGTFNAHFNNAQNCSQTASYTVASPELPCPGNLRATCDKDTANFNWSSVDGAGTYYISINKEPFDNWDPSPANSGGDISSYVNSGTSYSHSVAYGSNYTWSVYPLADANHFDVTKIFKCPAGAILNCPAPTNTPTPANTLPLPNITWVIRSKIICPDGTRQTIQSRSYYSSTEQLRPIWKYGNLVIGDRTDTIKPYSINDSVFFDLVTSAGRGLSIIGSSPDRTITYDDYWDTNINIAHWRANELPSGTYDFEFRGTSEICTVVSSNTPTNTPVPTNTPTPTPTNTPVPTNTPTPTPTNTPVPTNTPINTPTPTPTIPNVTIYITQYPSTTPVIVYISTTPVPTSVPTRYVTSRPTSTPISTYTPRPTRVLASEPSPTSVELPKAGIEFPIQGLTTLGIIMTLLGFLILL